MPKVKIKNLARIGIRSFILKHAKKFKKKYNYCWFSANIDFTDDPNAYVKLKRNRKHKSLTIIDLKTNKIVNDKFYRLVYPSTYKVELNFHNELLDFYDWYCQMVVSNNDLISNFVNCNEILGILEFYDLDILFGVIFNELTTITNANNLNPPSKLKNLILDFDKYKKLYALR